MSVLKKFKKKFISKLRRIRKHYRYKVYFPKVYSSYCTEPVQENKVLFLEMRFTKLSNSFELIYKALEESGEYDLKCSYVQFNFIRGREFTPVSYTHLDVYKRQIYYQHNTILV